MTLAYLQKLTDARSEKVEMVFSSRSFLQKTNERILLYYYETSGRLVFVRFFGGN